MNAKKCRDLTNPYPKTLMESPKLRPNESHHKPDGIKTRFAARRASAGAGIARYPAAADRDRGRICA
jgi:hypothetical protein